MAEALLHHALLDPTLERQGLGGDDLQGLVARILLGFRHYRSSSKQHRLDRVRLTSIKVGCENAKTLSRDYEFRPPPAGGMRNAGPGTPLPPPRAALPAPPGPSLRNPARLRQRAKTPALAGPASTAACTTFARPNAKSNCVEVNISTTAGPAAPPPRRWTA